MPSSTNSPPPPRIQVSVQQARIVARQAIETLGDSLLAGQGGDLNSTYRTSGGAFLGVVVEELGAQAGVRMGNDACHLPVVPAPSGVLDQVRVIARRLAAEADQAPDMLSALYEDLLAHAPTTTPAGAFRLYRAGGHRKSQGCFYTARAVAETVAAAALEPLHIQPTDRELPHVLDPAMGTGVFLLAATRYLAGASGASPATIAEQCLYGVDRDPMAVELAVLSLWLEWGARPSILRRHLLSGDLLGAQGPTLPDRVDVVLGNPPWGAHYPPEERRRLKERFPDSTSGVFDSFKLFLDLASRLSTGTVGMVVPQAVLAQREHADVRRMLLARLDPHAVIRLPDTRFPDAAAPACALIFGARPGPATVHFLNHDGRRADIPAGAWRTGDFQLAPDGVLDLLRELQERHPLLGDLTHLYRARDSGINYNRAAIARRVLYTGETPDDPRDIARYRGRNFNRYTTIASGGWLRHDAVARLQPGETLSLDWATYRLPEKIVIRQTADRIIATLDSGGMAMGRSVIAITRRRDASLQALLACLNSRLFTVLYRALAGEEGRIFPQVKVGRLLALPLPAVCSMALTADLLAKARAAIESKADRLVQQAREDPPLAWACLHLLAVRLLSTEGDDEAAEALTDSLVYGLYGLDQQAIDLVEGTDA